MSTRVDDTAEVRVLSGFVINIEHSPPYVQFQNLFA